jgi:hypothetical protein
VGETPNLAARLEGLGMPGSLVIADATRHQLGQLFNNLAADDRDGSFATEVAQLKCPHLPAADIERSARLMALAGQLLVPKVETKP